jgi:hypothetical protein
MSTKRSREAGEMQMIWQFLTIRKLQIANCTFARAKKVQAAYVGGFQLLQLLTPHIGFDCYRVR